MLFRSWTTRAESREQSREIQRAERFREQRDSESRELQRAESREQGGGRREERREERGERREERGERREGDTVETLLHTHGERQGEGVTDRHVDQEGSEGQGGCRSSCIDTHLGAQEKGGEK